MFDEIRKLPFVRKLFQLKSFVTLVISAWIQFRIYKLKKKEIVRDEEDIRGKCVVVTGGWFFDEFSDIYKVRSKLTLGSNGIGRSSAREFAKRGATVVIGDVDVMNGQKTVKEIQMETGNNNVVR